MDGRWQSAPKKDRSQMRTLLTVLTVWLCLSSTARADVILGGILGAEIKNDSFFVICNPGERSDICTDTMRPNPNAPKQNSSTISPLLPGVNICFSGPTCVMNSPLNSNTSSRITFSTDSGTTLESVSGTKDPSRDAAIDSDSTFDRASSEPLVFQGLDTDGLRGDPDGNSLYAPLSATNMKLAFDSVLSANRRGNIEGSAVLDPPGVPEPASVTLLGTVALAMFIIRRALR
jgi:hypothetical protein